MWVGQYNPSRGCPTHKGSRVLVVLSTPIHRASPSNGGYDKSDLSEVLTPHCLLVISENPEGVSWCINPSFPLKGSVSEPEGEAWEAEVPLPCYPEGVAYIHSTNICHKVQPLRGSWLWFPTLPRADLIRHHWGGHPVGCSGGLSFKRVHFELSNGGGGLALGEGEELVAEIFVLLTAKLYLTGQPLLDRMNHRLKPTQYPNYPLLLLHRRDRNKNICKTINR